MLSSPSWIDIRSRVSRGLHYRYTAYLLFLILMMYKLIMLDHQLHIANMKLDRADYVIAVGSLLLISFWTLWLPARGRLASLTLLNLVWTGILYADLIYYRYFDDFITVPVLMQAGQVGSLGDSIRSLIHGADLFFFIDWVVIVPFTAVMVFRKRTSTSETYGFPGEFQRHRRKRVFGRLAAGTLVFILGMVMTFVPIKKASDTWAVGLFEGNWWNITLYNVTGLIGFHGYDLYRYGRDHLIGQPKLADEEVNQVKAWFDAKHGKASGTGALFGKYKGSNVIMIQTEAFMNFVIGQSIGGQEITPNFNRLMKDSMYFSNFYHQTGQGRTSDADFVTHSSLLPLPTGSVFTRYADREYDTLPEILKEQGYAANVFHAYDSSFWNRTTMYREMNYDRFYSKKDYEMNDVLGWSLSDKAFFAQSLDRMKGIEQPFYSFLITLTSHHPYYVPKDARKLDTGEFEGTMFGDYLQSIHYVDEAFGQFEEQMKQQGLWDNTILLIYGDHDNSIKEISDYEKFLGRDLNALDMELIMNQVPLLIRLPDGGNAGVYPEAAGMMNVTPSILHLLGVSEAPYYWIGGHLFDDKPRLIPLRSGAFSEEKVFYLPSETAGLEGGTCYDLTTRQPTDIQACRDGYDETRKQLQISDQVITYDLLKLFKAQGKGEME
ncbi:LTA synthase family protein [Paenibacillus sp. BR1-192]|uniref:LTA synthase family protein n=1 Tax=Paenibacillus sp. BR1-192 TaxID=3032287 RepID=UPI00240E0E66|nr:LTA synthase family protein [Paenibacillus sp. BR1-192]WFB56958.1 LTA synthase family protein [Paenibacillus sp. BR1-192]